MNDDPIRSADQFEEPTRSVLRMGRWMDALRQAEAGEPALLETLLRSDWPIPAQVRLWIAERTARLASRRRGRPTKLGDHLLAVERRQYLAWGGPKDEFVASFADTYSIKFEDAKKMLEAGE